MKKIEKMVKAYNEYATKHGYSIIKVDYEKKKVVGTLDKKYEKQYSGFFGYFKNLMITYRNNYLWGDYIDIVNEVNKL